MNKTVKFITSIIEVLLGAGLMIGGRMEIVNEFLSGMGTGLLIVGTLQLIRLFRYKTDKTYQENVDIAANDERNKYISMKAWSWAGYIFVMINAVATLILSVLGQYALLSYTTGSICLILILYWVSYLVLRRKY